MAPSPALLQKACPGPSASLAWNSQSTDPVTLVGLHFRRRKEAESPGKRLSGLVSRDRQGTGIRVSASGATPYCSPTPISTPEEVRACQEGPAQLDARQISCLSDPGHEEVFPPFVPIPIRHSGW